MAQPSDSPSTPEPTQGTLQLRADLLRRLREFFWQRGFVEVETPFISDEIIPELHIEPMRLVAGGYLQASPEMHMKRLLAMGMGEIFQVTRSFRAGEHGPLHRPEFTIVEWYRVGDDMAAGMDLLDELLQSLLATSPAKRSTYAEAFQRHLQLCPHAAPVANLAAAAKKHGWRGPHSRKNPADDDVQHQRDELLNFLLATQIEPHLGCERPEILYHYPASQASLARVVELPEGHAVAERFELYYRGVELANGFHELADAAELRMRLTEVNSQRTADDRPALPLPEQLLAAMERPGLPPCTGCALGFDRLAMLSCDAASIDTVQIH